MSTSGGPAAPLAGVRVLDFTWVVAGPVATRTLADLGAEVIRVERRDSPDFGRRRGGLTGTLMRGKQSVVVDLARPEGRTLARRLALRADVVADNFSARVMPSLGLDRASLMAERPDVITLRMTGFGLDGPDRDHVSYGPTLQALCGFPHAMAFAADAPIGPGYSYSDVAAGNLGALAVLAALRHRRRTGEGMEIDLAQYEALAALLGPLLLAEGPIGALGNASPEAPGAPHGVYPCAGDDRWIALTVLDEVAWRGFVAALGAPAWTADPRFATGAGRLRHTEALDAHVTAWTRAQDADAAMALLQAHGVAAGRVADAADLCTRDPQLAARGHFTHVATPDGDTVRVDGPGFRLSATPAAPRGPGPLLGEHTDAVLARVLGLDAATIAALRAAGVVA
ncbi:MAG: CoA transferase [bacterium]|nr:CoA transferase [bacterium]